jgi:hypothetical protein
LKAVQKDRIGKPTVEELLGIARRMAARIEGSYLDHAESLYDERLSQIDRRYIDAYRRYCSKGEDFRKTDIMCDLTGPAGTRF